jgi:UDP-N-acetylglucosamine 2-epimerase (non-hydrolysing)
MKILICLGTRPEWLKIKPIVEKLNDVDYKLLFTGQHLDLLKDIDFNYKFNISTGTKRLDDIISTCLLQFPKDEFDYVLVQGDTASAFACAIAGFNRKIKIIHLESGLRTYDQLNPYPEESYRQMISRISDINLCPTTQSLNNLINEKVNGKNFVVGNTVLDNIVNLKYNTSYTNKVLITLHRRENHEIMDRWFTALNDIADEFPHLEFILPIHPNPEVQKRKHLLSDKIKIINPLNHSDLINLLMCCKFVITDSGGIQEEGCFLNKKIIVCRKTTERPEGINTGHITLSTEPEYLKNIVYKIDQNYYINNECPYGDGHSSTKIIDVINNDYSSTKRI